MPALFLGPHATDGLVHVHDVTCIKGARSRYTPDTRVTRADTPARNTINANRAAHLVFTCLRRLVTPG